MGKNPRVCRLYKDCFVTGPLSTESSKLICGHVLCLHIIVSVSRIMSESYSVESLFSGLYKSHPLCIDSSSRKSELHGLLTRSITKFLVWMTCVPSKVIILLSYLFSSCCIPDQESGNCIVDKISLTNCGSFPYVYKSTEMLG